MSVDVIVIGGGISGLATAANVARLGFEVKLLERQVTFGGNAISERFDGFLLERGPSTLNAAIPEAMVQVRTLGLATTAVDLGSGVTKRYLRDASRLWGFSVHPLGFFRSNYLSPLARLSMAAEIFPPGQGR